MTKIKTKKKFGQHFLINEDLALEISEKLILRKNIFRSEERRVGKECER